MKKQNDDVALSLMVFVIFIILAIISLSGFKFADKKAEGKRTMASPGSRSVKNKGFHIGHKLPYILSGPQIDTHNLFLKFIANLDYYRNI